MPTTIDLEGAAGLDLMEREGITSRIPRSFLYRSTVWQFNDVALMRIVVRALDMKGPVEASLDDLVCYFVESGQLVLRGDNPASFEAGDILLLPQWVPFEMVVRERSQALAIRFNADILEGMLPRSPESYVAVRKGPLARAAMRFANSLTESDASDSAVENYAIGQLLAEMVGGLLLSALGESEPSTPANESARDRARAVIAQSYSDPTLTSQIVAREISVSLRLLQQVFAEVQTTVSDEIRAHRVSAAEALLKSPRYEVMSIEDIAQRAGFSSGVKMRRAFHQHGKPSPSQIRRGQPLGLDQSGGEEAH